MRRLGVLIVGIMLLWGLPIGASAQGFFGAGGPLPFPGSACLDAGTGSGLLSVPSLYVGWQEHPRGSTWPLQRVDSTGTAPWPLRGFWFGAAKDVTLYGGFGIIASGGIFVPWRSEGTWYTSPVADSFSFEVPYYNWWNVDGLFKCPVAGSFEFLAGFRWDHTSTRVDYNDNTSDDYVLNAYIPLIGAQINQRFHESSLLLRVIASPVVRGQVSYHFWNRLGGAEFGNFPVKDSSFVEVFAEYKMRLVDNVRVGGFGKWNVLQVRTDTTRLGGSAPTETVSWAVYIQSWTLGYEVSLDFWNPF